MRCTTPLIEQLLEVKLENLCKPHEQPEVFEEIERFILPHALEHRCLDLIGR